MDGPQVENGYTRVANELLDAICRHDFSKRELKIVLAIIRRTYGYQQKVMPMSVHGLGKSCGISLQHAYKVVGDLVQKNVLMKLRTDESSHGQNLNAYGINKRYTEWLGFSVEPLPKQDPSQNGTGSQNGTTTPPKTGVEPLPKRESLYKEVKKVKERVKKDKSESIDSRQLFADTVNMMLSDFPDLPESTAADFLRHRKSKKSPLTATAWKLQVGEIKKSGWSAKRVLEEIIFRDWKAAKADWLQKSGGGENRRDRERREWFEQATGKTTAATGNVIDGESYTAAVDRAID